MPEIEAHTLQDKAAMVAYSVLVQSETAEEVQGMEPNARYNVIAHAIAKNLDEMGLLREDENRVLVLDGGGMISGPMGGDPLSEYEGLVEDPEIPTCPECGRKATGPDMTLTHVSGCKHEKGELEW